MPTAAETRFAAETREAARNIPDELGVQLDTPLPNNPPGGAYGKVFYGSLVSGPQSGRRVAVKIQRAGPMSQHEANVLQLLHNGAFPNTPPMLPDLFGEKAHNGWHYLVMDGDGKENGWSEWFDSIHPVGTTHDADGERTLAERFVQAAVAILFMHAAGQAHHDIKPDNTMLVDTGSTFLWGVCVIDFGLTCSLAPGASSKTTGGTPAFIAPEVLVKRHEGWSHGFPADLWSLGITLFVAAAGFQPFRQAFTAQDVAKQIYSSANDVGTACFTKLEQAQQLKGQSSSTATIFRHWNQMHPTEIPAICPFSAELTALLDAMLTIDRTKRPSIAETLQLALAWARAVLGPAGTDDPPPWLLAASAAAEAPFAPTAIAEAVASNAPGSSAQHAAVASTESAAGAPALRSMSVSSESTPTPSLTPSLAEMNAAYEAAMDEAATISSRSTSGGTEVWHSAVSMEEAGTGEGEAELQMSTGSSSDGASQPAFTDLSAGDEPPAFRSLSAEDEPAPKRPRATAVPLLPPRPVRQNAFVLPRAPP